MKRKPAATPELRDAILQVRATVPTAKSLTLAFTRSAIEHESNIWFEGEILHPQDRTSLIIEIDELIDCYGAETEALDFVPVKTRRKAADGGEHAPRHSAYRGYFGPARRLP